MIMETFQSTLPVWGVTYLNGLAKSGKLFQSTLPVWGVTANTFRTRGMLKFQSTLPVWGVTICLVLFLPAAEISIHTPRMGSDQSAGAECISAAYFNPHSPYGEWLMLDSSRTRL